jgi:hypothetical protein
VNARDAVDDAAGVFQPGEQRMLIFQAQVGVLHARIDLAVEGCAE